MSPDADSQPDRDDRADGLPFVQEGDPSSRGVPLTTAELCRWAMFLVGSGMVFAVGEEWWVRLIIAGMVVLILFMSMVQERWKTRERHRLIESALKRTAASDGSGRSQKKAPGRTRPRRGGKPVENGASQHGQHEPARLGNGAVPPPAPERREAVGEQARPTPTSAETETPPEGADTRNGP